MYSFIVFKGDFYDPPHMWPLYYTCQLQRKNERTECTPMAVDLKVSRIRRHLAEGPSFGGQTAGAGGTPRRATPQLSVFHLMDSPLDVAFTADS